MVWGPAEVTSTYSSTGRGPSEVEAAQGTPFWDSAHDDEGDPVTARLVPDDPQFATESEREVWGTLLKKGDRRLDDARQRPAH